MSNRLTPYAQALPQVSLGDIHSGASFTVNMDGRDTLILDVDYTYAAATALTFTFAAGSPNSSSTFGLTVLNIASQTFANASFSYALAGASVKKRFIFPLSGAGVIPDRSGNITVTLTGTGGNSGDTAVVTPIAAVLG